MLLTASCVRCSAPVGQVPAGGWACPDHGSTGALWRAEEATYAAFVEHLQVGFERQPYPLHQCVEQCAFVVEMLINCATRHAGFACDML